MKETTQRAAGQPVRRRFFYGWNIVIASFFTNALTTAAYFQGFQAFFLPILNTFGWSRTAISGAFSLRQVESGILGPLAGFLVDRLGARKLIIYGALVFGVGVIGLSLTQNLFMFYFFFLMASVGTAGAGHGVTWSTIIARWFRKHRGLAMGIATSGPILGGAFVVPNALLVEEFGWRPVLFVYGVIVTVAVVALGLVARDRPEPYGLLPDGTPLDPPVATSSDTREERRARSRRAAAVETGLTASQVLRTRPFWVLSVFMGGAFMASSGMQTHQLPYFESIGFSTSAAAATVFGIVALGGIGRMGASALVDYFDYRVVLTLVMLMITASLLYLALVPITSFLMAVPFMALFGIGFSSTIPLRPVVGSLLFGTRSIGAIIGLLQGSSIASGVLGPLIMGYVFDTTGSYGASIWILAAITMASLPLLLLLPPPSKLPMVPPSARHRDAAGGPPTPRP